MRVTAEGTRIRVQLPKAEVEEVDLTIIALRGAEWSLSVNQADLATADLQPYKDDVEDAWGAYEDLFAESLTISEAETLCTQLFASITKAKAAAGRFNVVERTADVIPFPIHRVKR